MDGNLSSLHTLFTWRRIYNRIHLTNSKEAFRNRAQDLDPRYLQVVEVSRLNVQKKCYVYKHGESQSILKLHI